MDVVLNAGKLPQILPYDYKSFVLQGDPDTAWTTLVSLGRPLWCTFVPSRDRDVLHEALFLAATKFLNGLSPIEEVSYADSKTLHGVASILCRIGVRPQSNAPFASQVVSDFMAVLHYVSYTREEYICGYVSEPVLAFGAAQMWYEKLSSPGSGSSLPLQKYILPHFRDLLQQGLLDTSGIGQVVARIFLLLAMDATIMDGHPLIEFSL